MLVFAVLFFSSFLLFVLGWHSANDSGLVGFIGSRGPDRPNFETFLYGLDGL